MNKRIFSAALIAALLCGACGMPFENTQEHGLAGPAEHGGAVTGGVTEEFEFNGYDAGFMESAAMSPEAEEAYESPVEYNTDEYEGIKENGFVSTRTNRFSTFGMDVDTAGYSDLINRIENGYSVYSSAIRIEEMINYFDYDYAAPEKGDKFGKDIRLTDCPWREDTLLMRIGLKAAEADTAVRSNLVFLIDVSGSMSDDNKLPLFQKAFSHAVEGLPANSRVSIVTYASGEELLVDGCPIEDKEGVRKLAETVAALEASGSTNGEAGIQMAYETAKKNYIDGGNNRIILVTDGDLNVGISSTSELVELVEEKKKDGIFLTVLGMGMGNYKDHELEQVADSGDGNYYYINRLSEARRILGDKLCSTLFTVAKDAKVQVEFNPARIEAFRLIGYENRAMAAEDFENDDKDGGEVGSGQTVTVLYELIPVGSSAEAPEVTSRYETETTGGDMDEYAIVNLRYKEPDGDESVLEEKVVTPELYSPEMDDQTSWAAGVAQVGMLLRNSEHKGTSDYDEVSRRLKAIPGVLDDDYRLEFLNLIKDCKETTVEFEE